MAETRQKVEGKFLEYLDKPLVREGNTICYGDMNEKCILVLEIMSYKEVEGKKLPKDVFIQVIDSKDPNKININMIANAEDVLIASSYTD